jgi:hypothetical protein
MAHSTFKGENTPAWKEQGKGGKGPQGDPMSGEARSGKHSSAGPEREMRKEMTKTEEAARQAHRRTDTKDHPSFNNAKPTTRG